MDQAPDHSVKPSERMKKLGPLIAARWAAKLEGDRARKAVIVKIPDGERSIMQCAELDAINARQVALALGLIDDPFSSPPADAGKTPE